MEHSEAIKRCVTCILPETYPGIRFDADGVCSECAKFTSQGGPAVDLGALNEKVERIIAESKATAPHYDALVAYSGGKDSTYLIQRLQTDYQLRILAFTLDNWFLPQQTFRNINQVIKRLGVDHIFFKPDYELCRRVFLRSAESDIYPISLLKHGSALCVSCIRMVSNLSVRLAIEKQIPMVMLGNSPGQIIQSEHELLYQDNRIPYELKRQLFAPLANEIGDDVYHYLMLTKNEYQADPFPHTISILPIIGYDEAEIYRAVEELGWKRPGNVDSCSTNCRMNSLGVVKHCQKLHFHPYEGELSMMVRMGSLDREAALGRILESTRLSQGIAVEVEQRLKSD
jgi:tRNA(Ile)-lysidine synthase TilS/MesJ